MVIAMNEVPTYWKPSLKINPVWLRVISPAYVAAVAAKKKTQDETFLFAKYYFSGLSELYLEPLTPQKKQ